MYTAATLLYPHALATSVTLPMEILQAASQMASARTRGSAQVNLLLAAPEKELITLSSGVTLMPHVSYGDLPELDLLIVDEAQDLTPSQWQMVAKMSEHAKRTIIAGDDDQAIHEWTGVKVEDFLSCSDKRVVLSQSYRMPQAVHNLSQMIVKRIDNRIVKEFEPTDREGSIRYHVNIETVPLDTGSWTLMARTNSYAWDLAKQVRAYGYLYSFRGRGSVSEAVAERVAAEAEPSSIDSAVASHTNGRSRKSRWIACVSARDAFSALNDGIVRALVRFAADHADALLLVNQFQISHQVGVLVPDHFAALLVVGFLCSNVFSRQVCSTLAEALSQRFHANISGVCHACADAFRGGHPGGLDKTYAHKISLVWNPANETYYMFYNAVGDKGRGIGLITSKPITKQQHNKPDAGDGK